MKKEWSEIKIGWRYLLTLLISLPILFFGVIKYMFLFDGSIGSLFGYLFPKTVTDISIVIMVFIFPLVAFFVGPHLPSALSVALFSWALPVCYYVTLFLIKIVIALFTDPAQFFSDLFLLIFTIIFLAIECGGVSGVIIFIFKR